MRENQPNCPKVFVSVGSFKSKKGNDSKSLEPIFLKFCNIVRVVVNASANFFCGQLIFHARKNNQII